MKLLDTIRLFCNIGDDATKILHKKVGKNKGLGEIEKQIRDEATSSAEKSFGGKLDRVAQTHIDRFVKTRMGYMKKAFTKLNNPKTDTSKQRGEFIGDTETKSAKHFGQWKGMDRLAKTRKKNIYKQWIDNDGCTICVANADEGPIPVGDEFSSGDQAPLAHPSCNCYLIFSDDDGNEIDLDYDEGEEE